MALRLFCLLILLIFVLVFPWWLAFCLAFFLVFWLDNFYEAAFPFLVFDLLQGLPEESWLGIPFFGTIFILALFLASDLIKERVAFFQD